MSNPTTEFVLQFQRNQSGNGWVAIEGNSDGTRRSSKSYFFPVRGGLQPSADGERWVCRNLQATGNRPHMYTVELVRKIGAIYQIRVRGVRFLENLQMWVKFNEGTAQYEVAYNQFGSWEKFQHLPALVAAGQFPELIAELQQLGFTEILHFLPRSAWVKLDEFDPKLAIVAGQ